jgi:hypothetical protein
MTNHQQTLSDVTQISDHDDGFWDYSQTSELGDLIQWYEISLYLLQGMTAEKSQKKL